MSIYLKVKSKSLAEEAKIIRKEEKQALKARDYFSSKQQSDSATLKEILFDTLRNHRVIQVRQEARATFLARAFIQGRKYLEVEHKKSVVTQDIINRLKVLVTKYHKPVSNQELHNWIAADLV